MKGFVWPRRQRPKRRRRSVWPRSARRRVAAPWVRAASGRLVPLQPPFRLLRGRLGDVAVDEARAGVRAPAPFRSVNPAASGRQRRRGRLGEGPAAAFGAAVGPGRARVIPTRPHLTPLARIPLLHTLPRHCSTHLIIPLAVHRHSLHHNTHRALSPLTPTCKQRWPGSSGRWFRPRWRPRRRWSSPRRPPALRRPRLFDISRRTFVSAAAPRRISTSSGRRRRPPSRWMRPRRRTHIRRPLVRRLRGRSAVEASGCRDGLRPRPAAASPLPPELPSLPTRASSIAIRWDQVSFFFWGGVGLGCSVRHY